MSSPTHKTSAEAAEKIAVRWQSSIIATMVAVFVGVSGFFGSVAFSSLRSMGEQQVEIVTIQAGQSESLARLGVSLEKLAEEVRENDRRITRREDNQFTARDAAKLQTIATTNATQITAVSQRLSQLVSLNVKQREADRAEVAKLRTAMQKLYLRLGDGGRE